MNDPGMQAVLEKPPARRRATVRTTWVLAILQLLVASHFAIAYIDGTSSWIDLSHYVAGKERLPFQFRALTAWTMAALVHLPGVATLAAHASKKIWADPLVITWCGLVMVSTLWILHSAREAAATLFADRLAARALALTFMIPLYIDYEALANSSRLSYAYDLPSTALFIACFVAILHGQNLRVVILFTLATLSRETAIYLLPIFLLYAWIDAQGGVRPGLLKSLTWAGAMAAIWVLVKVALSWLYDGNRLTAQAGHLPGPVRGMEFQLFDNLHALINPLQWPDIMSSLGWLWVPVLAFWSRIGDKRLQTAIALGTPGVAIVMLLVGRITEPRVFGELAVLYWMAALMLIRDRCWHGPANVSASPSASPYRSQTGSARLPFPLGASHD